MTVNRISKRENYVEFLRAHPEIKNAKIAVIELKMAGLIAPSAYWLDCNTVVRFYQEKAR